MGPSGLWALLWGDAGQFHEVRVGTAVCWIPCENTRAFKRLLGMDNVRVSYVPRTMHDELALGSSWVLWARLETPDAAKRLARFRVGPTLVIREGASSRRTALWALSEPLSGEWITKATERLSNTLKGRRGAADPSATFPSPFGQITLDRARPSRCYVEYESETRATARQIVGGLVDAPAPHDWRQRVA